MKGAITKSPNLCFIAGLLCCFLSQLSPTICKGQDTVVRLHYAHFMPIDIKQARLSDQWCKEVEKRTGGKVRITMYPGQTLIPSIHTYDAVAKGIASIGHSYFPISEKKFSLTDFISLPLDFESGYVSTKLINEYYRKFKPADFDDVKVLYLHAYRSVGFFVVMNKAKWNSLPLDVQSTIDQINEEWIEMTGKLWDDTELELKQPSLSKLNFVKLSEQEKARWKNKNYPAIDQYLENARANNLPGDAVISFARESLAGNNKGLIISPRGSKADTPVLTGPSDIQPYIAGWKNGTPVAKARAIATLSAIDQYDAKAFLASISSKYESDAVTKDYPAFINRGEKGSEYLLSVALFRQGTREMVEAFYNSGNQVLKESAILWAKEHGGYFTSRLGNTSGPRWGKAKRN